MYLCFYRASTSELEKRDKKAAIAEGKQITS